MDKNLKKNLQARNVLRVALYVRVSSREQADEGYSIGEQTDRLEKYADAMGWDIHKVYIDPGYSGGNIDRPGLNEMIKDIKAGKIDTVVVYKLDRLSRSQFDTLFLIEKVFLPNDTDFVSMTENFSTNSPLGRAMIGFLAVFAQLEKDKINERTLMGKEARAKEGKWGGGSSEPIGYNYNVATGELEIDEYERMQVLEAVDLFLSGMPLKTICNVFDSKGYLYRGRSKRMHKWDPKRLKYVLGNKIYLGYIKYRDEWYKGSHTPIYDEETYNKLTRLLEQRAEKYAHHKKRCAGQTTYLGGFIYCKRCGARYAKNTWSNRKKERKHFYGCYSRMNKIPKMVKDPNCQNKNWKMDELDAIIFDAIRQLTLDPEFIANLKKDASVEDDTPQKIEVLKKEIESIDSQIARLMDLYVLGHLSVDLITERVDPLAETKKKLEADLEELHVYAPELSEEEALEVASNFEEVLAREDLNEIRLLIETLISRIELDGDDVYIHWRFI